jgi:hypothetical protein
MKILRQLGIGLVLCPMILAQIPEDPVLKARAQRGLSTDLADGDLPPVPRTITEPPPLPSPEIHHKDLRRSRYTARPRGKRKSVKQVRATTRRSTKIAPKKK